MHSLYTSSRAQEKKAKSGLAREVGKMRGSSEAICYCFDNAARYPRNPVAFDFRHSLVSWSVAEHTPTATTIGFRLGF
ncbi:uncharacterized protein ColSpa_01157 [Colletotrichum spaethianum]|uniref:Uncharacterized protein n=1 Tax=Colletotrichum spaethianum TaxID=700344 RepID=A0AA37L2V7_9PEZI|nr:uncharacterized protein ColSpa_01157 [Colletotrichum spaethianum]GKT40976.1 hypothetical protein ColSpa_01157 [Colletotrichum spaethianum]